MIHHGSEKTRALLEELQRLAWATRGKDAQRVLRLGAAAAAAFIPRALAHYGFHDGSPEYEAAAAAMRNDAEAASPPTRYEEPIWHAMVAEYADEIEAAAQELGRPLPFRPLFGTIPSGRVNASAIYVADADEYIIAIDNGLFTFAGLMAKIVARCFPFTARGDGVVHFLFTPDAVRGRLEAEGDILRHALIDALAAYVVYGDSRRAKQYFVDGPYLPIVDHLLTSMEYFVLAHEYGHIVGGHLTSTVRRLKALPSQGTQEILLEWSQEFAADKTGVALAMRCMARRGVGAAATICGSELFFACIDLVERAAEVLRTGSQDSRSLSTSTHPPPASRRAALRAEIKQASGFREDVLGFANGAHFALDALWSASVPIWLRLHSEGLRPLPVL